MSPGIIKIDPELCTGCRHCALHCPVQAIEGTTGQPHRINPERCVMCGQCIQICPAYVSRSDAGINLYAQKRQERNLPVSVTEPLFAAYYDSDVPAVKAALADKDLFTVVQCSAAVRVSIAEEFGMPLGSLTPGKLAAALQKLGFKRVYDSNFAADLNTMEVSEELLERLEDGGVLPLFTSCCPAWVKFVEQEYPDLIAHLSTCKSPQQMGGALFKTYGAALNKVTASRIYSVAVMPCTGKKFECQRPEMQDSGYRDVDVVLTTRELAQLIKDAGIDFKNLLKAKFDKPLGVYSGAGAIFGASGGVMEAALRTGYELVTRQAIPDVKLAFVRGGEGVRRANVRIGSWQLKVVVVSGLKYAVPILEAIRKGKADFHFMEVMACPAGCISGGGQPKVWPVSDRKLAYDRRAHSIYRHDERQKNRKAHNNPAIQRIYEEFLEEQNGYQLLHTRYTPRSRQKSCLDCTNYLHLVRE